jgi:hypothetical protein
MSISLAAVASGTLGLIALALALAVGAGAPPETGEVGTRISEWICNCWHADPLRRRAAGE